ncbi:Spy/CpxP family protein refolding chaperone [Reinekea marinisedimentorum]|uniref:LTXXQ motif family protein n=1 Tax=Reinekea marinisedimentorum TaxID=230495 RepID=A0A4R3HXV0_9GAMM|nr:Spy/CpxP family protein refolding chaperone [Reinekea marinisedimentorum]TCS37674.1 LTXXQ motif family protein [Reinekea marinisedimentorum]
MSTMKKKIAAGGLALILATAAVGAFAKGGQENGDKGERRGNVNLDYIYTELALSEEQQADVNAVLEAFRDQTREDMKAAMEEFRDAEERPSREEMAEIREAHRAELLASLTDELNTVLTADQAEDLVTYIDAHSQGGPRGPQGDRAKNSSDDES